MRRPWACANSTASGVVVPVAAATKRRCSPAGATDSTSVRPHQPSPTIAASITSTSGGAARRPSAGPDQRVAGVSGEAGGLGHAELAAHDVRTEHERGHLVERVAPAHALAPHAAVGAQHE